MIVDMLVEGVTDEIVARKLIRFTRHEPGAVHGKAGQGYIRATISGYNVRATFGNPVLALVDFADTRLDCPPQVPSTWLAERSSRLLLRVVVRELESWLLADRPGVARFLGISAALVPRNPEQLPDPKQKFVNLARRSRRRRIHENIVPQEGASSIVGPGYIAAVYEFVESFWNVQEALHYADSLYRCVERLRELS